MNRDPSLDSPNIGGWRRARMAAVAVALGGTAFLGSACSSSSNSVEVRVSCAEHGIVNKGKVLVFGNTSASNSIEYIVSDGKEDATFGYQNGILTSDNLQIMLADASRGTVLKKFPDATLFQGQPSGVGNGFENGGYALTLKCNDVTASQIDGPTNRVSTSQIQ